MLAKTAECLGNLKVVDVKAKKSTALRIPRRSPIQVLTQLNLA